MIKISVITVVKNAKKTIEDTILSVLNQTHKNIEFIIIDGGSNDGTIDIIDKYKNQIAYFVSEPDTGIYNAMNKGIGAATGDVLYFLNANDSVYDNYVFEKVIKHFQNDKELDFLFGNVQFTDSSRNDCSVYKHDDFKTVLTFLDRNICHQVIFYNSRVFKQYGVYDETYKILSDYDYNVKLLVKNKVKIKYLDLFIARFELGGFSANATTIKNKEMTRIYNQYFKSNKIHKTDRFFMKFFGSPYKALKKLKYNKTIQDYIFDVLQIKLRT